MKPTFPSKNLPVLKESAFVLACFFAAIFVGLYGSDRFFEESLVFLGACTAFTFTSLIHHKNDARGPVQKALGACTCLLLVSVGLYFLVKDSLLAEIGHICLTLTSLSLVLSSCFMSSLFLKPQYHTVGFLGISGLALFSQTTLTLAIDNERVSIEMLQGLLIFSVVALGAAQILFAYRSIRQKSFPDHEFFYLSVPLSALSVHTLIEPGDMLYFNLTMSAACLALYYRGHLIHIETTTKERVASIAFHQQMIEVLRQLSFEAREGINNIILQTDMIVDDPQGDPTPYCQGIKDASLNMLRAVDRYVTLQQIVEGVQLKKSDTTIQQLNDAVANSFRNPTGSRQLFFHSPDSIAIMQTNPTLLSQAILDIVNRDQYQTLDFSLHVYNTIRGQERFTNIDIRGFTQDINKLDKAHNRFKQFDYSEFRFVVNIAESLGGGFLVKDLSQESPFFTIYIPRKASTTTDDPQDHLVDSVLVVDDDPEVMNLIADFIESYGIKSIRAIEGSQALELYQKNKPQCVITDIKMPQMTGIELAEKIKPDSCTVIGISGAPETESDSSKRKSAFDTFHQKPPDLNLIVKEVQEAIDRSKNPKS